MDLSEKQIAEIAREVFGDLWGSGHARDRPPHQVCESIQKSVAKAVENLEDENKPLYFFNMQRRAIPEGDSIAKDAIDEPPRVYMKILAEDQTAACREAGRISGDHGEGYQWLFQPESIVPLLPPSYK